MIVQPTGRYYWSPPRDTAAYRPLLLVSSSWYCSLPAVTAGLQLMIVQPTGSNCWSPPRDTAAYRPLLLVSSSWYCSLSAVTAGLLLLILQPTCGYCWCLPTTSWCFLCSLTEPQVKLFLVPPTPLPNNNSSNQWANMGMKHMGEWGVGHHTWNMWGVGEHEHKTYGWVGSGTSHMKHVGE